jgi:hypothetical protein
MRGVTRAEPAGSAPASALSSTDRARGKSLSSATRHCPFRA